MMIHYQDAAKHEPKLRRMQPHGIRPGVCMDDHAATLSLPNASYHYDACWHKWLSLDTTGRYKACRYCGLGWDTHKDQETPVVREHCCTCLNSYKRNKKKGASLPDPVALGVLYICERCGQAICLLHSPADEDYPFMHCRSCQLETTKERKAAYAERKAEIDAAVEELGRRVETEIQKTPTASIADIAARLAATR